MTMKLSYSIAAIINIAGVIVCAILDNMAGVITNALLALLWVLCYIIENEHK